MRDEEPIVVTGEVVGISDVETVNRHALERLDALILKSKNPEEILTCVEALAKYNTSIRNNQVFTPEETEEEKNQKARQAAVADILKAGK